MVALPVLPGEDGEPVLLGPGAAELADELGIDLVGAAEVHGLTGATAEVGVVPVPGGTAANPDLRLVLLVGVGAARAIDLRRAGAALARATRDRDAVATSIPLVHLDADEAVEAFVVGAMLGSLRLPLALHRRRAPAGTTRGARRPDRHRRPGRPRARGRAGRGRLALAPARHRPLEPEEPRLAGRAGP
ncbi:M17 family peptidase N-terminal domain-containing protein [Nocardioides convexus]|uniref:M17 family peptidase N-terminal domain-containing protein n=1 Tax=Nocardioides convexus TaxID=2712224 RepID=UPI0024185643|nr:M17 family peptidase N-terminal domain-containing protein [Nocardioides convexus]